MPNTNYELTRATTTAAQDAFANRLISKKALHRLTDGTVSSHDLTEAKKLVQEQRALYEARKADHPNDKKKWQQLEKNYYQALRLHGTIERQYGSQGYVESGAENIKDRWNGSSW